MPRPPMVAIIGRKNSGKTTLLVQLAAELSRRGHRVMTIKHGAHTFNIDPSTTDTYRHYHEGHAERVAMVAPDKFALVMRWTEELQAEDVVDRYMNDADIVLCEGFKASSIGKIEIHRAVTQESPLWSSGLVDESRYCALVTDEELATAPPFPVVRLGDGDWLGNLASLVEREIMKSC